jgi:hypothetical protein
MTSYIDDILPKLQQSILHRSGPDRVAAARTAANPNGMCYLTLMSISKPISRCLAYMSKRESLEKLLEPLLPMELLTSTICTSDQISLANIDLMPFDFLEKYLLNAKFNYYLMSYADLERLISKLIDIN